MVAEKHDCRKESEIKHATFEHPYHFIESGLPNVYLVGIDYRICPACKKQAADIPALEDLMIKIARTVVRKESPLSGPEIRFLRKRLRKRSADFGKIIGVVPEQVSRWEKGDNAPSESADKLIRVFYCVLSEDSALTEQVSAHIDSWLATLPGEETKQNIQAHLRDNEEWAAEPVAA